MSPMRAWPGRSCAFPDRLKNGRVICSEYSDVAGEPPVLQYLRMTRQSLLSQQAVHAQGGRHMVSSHVLFYIRGRS